jgi:hypothetical protein
MNDTTMLLPLKTRVSHFDGGPSNHGFGTIIDYNGIRPNTYAKENLKEAAEMAGEVGLLGGLINGMYDGVRCPYVVQWDNGYTDVYEPSSVQELTAEIYAAALRARFEWAALSQGYILFYSTNNEPGLYVDPETDKAWKLWLSLYASMRHGRELEFPIS